KMAQFSVRLAEDPGSVTDAQLAQLQSQLNPLQAQKVKLDLIQAIKHQNAESQSANLLISQWGDSGIHARAGEAAQNKAFDTLVQKVVSSSASTGQGTVSRD